MISILFAGGWGMVWGPAQPPKIIENIVISLSVWGGDGGPTPKIMETLCFLQFLGEVGGHGATRPTSNIIENIYWFLWFLERWELTGNTALHPKSLKT